MGHPARFQQTRRGITVGSVVGPYRVQSVLGEGGMGRVFRATHTLTNTDFALKTVHAHESISLECFDQEIVALRRLRHRGVVPIHDSGSEGGDPWYAMTLLQGPTLREMIHLQFESAPTSSQTRPLSTGGDSSWARVGDPVAAPRHRKSDLLRICLGLLDTLDFVHSQGVIHGDIKPENVFALSAYPVLVDFGLALTFGADRDLLSATRAAGSAQYMSPEQIRGELLDARSDMYALGCLIYECLAGHPPYVRDSVDATLLAHLNAKPPNLCELQPEVPRPLGALVDRLLAKSAAARPGYAREVLEAIKLHAAIEWDQPLRPPGVYLYRPAFVGRKKETRVLDSRLAALSSGSGGKLMVRGAAGIGKTRFLLKVIERAEAHGYRTLKFDPVGPIAGPYSSPLSLLLALTQYGEPVEPSQQHAASALLAATNERSSLRDEAARSAALAALYAFCTAQPLVLIVDQLENLDAQSRHLVNALLLADLRGTKLLLVFAESQELPEDANAEVLTLIPLTRAAVCRAIESSLCMEMPSRQLVSQAQRASGGNPAVLLRYLRTLLDVGVLQRDARRGWFIDWSKRSELAALAKRNASRQWAKRALVRLDPQQLEFAQAAALIGPSFRSQVLMEITSACPDAIDAFLMQARQMGIVHLERTGSYRFDRSGLRRLLLASTADSRIQTWHRTAADYYARAGIVDPGDRCRLANHLKNIGALEQATEQYAQAARHLQSQGQHWGSVRSFRAAVRTHEAIPQPHPIRVGPRLNEELGDAALLVRQLDEATAAYKAALKYPDLAPLEIARLYRKLASSLQRQAPLALAHLEHAARLLDIKDEDLAARSEALQAKLDAMFVHYWKQETDQLLEIASLIELDVQRCGSPPQLAAFHFNLAAGLMQKHRYVTGPRELQLVDLALDLYVRLDEAPKIAMCRFLRAMILLFSGRLQEAEAGFGYLLRLGESKASVTIQLRALTYLCLTHRKQRRNERVRALSASALSLATEHDMPEYRGTALANLAWLALCEGDVAECEKLTEQAISSWDASPINYSFYWTAVLPRMAALSHSKKPSPSELIALAARLLQRSQELPPPSLLLSLTEIAACTEVHVHRLEFLLKEAIEQARTHSWI